MLVRAVDRDPSNQRIAANLGFYYALDILRITNLDSGSGGRSPSEQDRLSINARSELDRTRNVFVLAGAGTALQNLFPRTPQARTPDGGREYYEMAAGFMVRARALDSGDAALRGPMPLIREYQEFLEIETASSRNSVSLPPPGTAIGMKPDDKTPPPVIRVGAKHTSREPDRETGSRVSARGDQGADPGHRSFRRRDRKRWARRESDFAVRTPLACAGGNRSSTTLPVSPDAAERNAREGSHANRSPVSLAGVNL